MELTRNRKIRLLLPIALASLLAACAAPRPPAPIVDRTPRSDSRPAASGPRQMDSHGNYAVKKGDTLFQISQDFGQTVPDLVAWNNLASAHDIQVGQLLRVAPAGTARALAAGAPPAAGAPSAGTAAVPAIEVRPLNTPPAAPAVAGSVTGTVAVNAPNKTAPRGDKQPYSEAALAELQKPESAMPAAAVTQSAARPAEKPAIVQVNINQEDAGIAWAWPADGKILSGFEAAKKGIDIGGKAGQPVLAAAAGKVMYAGSGIRGYGNLVIVKHTNNLLSAYAHNKTILVKEGQTVGKGDRIAEMGDTDADAVKLHFEIRQQGKPVDPAKFLPSR